MKPFLTVRNVDFAPTRYNDENKMSRTIKDTELSYSIGNVGPRENNLNAIN